MCSVYSYFGWITTCAEKEVIDTVLKNLRYDEQFINMFSTPKDSGNTGTNTVSFGAEIDLGIDSPHIYEHWLTRFEELLKKLDAFDAFVFIEYSHFGVFAVSYRSVYPEYRGKNKKPKKKYIKEMLDLTKLYPELIDPDFQGKSEECFQFGGSFPNIFTHLKLLELMGAKSTTSEIFVTIRSRRR